MVAKNLGVGGGEADLDGCGSEGFAALAVGSSCGFKNIDLGADYFGLMTFWADQDTYCGFVGWYKGLYNKIPPRQTWGDKVSNKKII